MNDKAKPTSGLIIYRGNSSLDTIVPTVADTMRKFGLEVKTQRFELQTPESSIDNWIVDNVSPEYTQPPRTLAEAAARTYHRVKVADETCGNVIYERLIHDSRYISLDSIATSAVLRIIDSRVPEVEGYYYSVPEGTSLEETLKRTEEAYVHILNNIEEKPSAIVIAERDLTDHVPFGDIVKQNKVEEYGSPVEILKSWFQKGIGSQIPINIVPGNHLDDLVEALRDLEDEVLQNTWLVIDRHYKHGASTNIHNASITDPREGKYKHLLQVPLDDFMVDVVKSGLYCLPAGFEATYLENVANITEDRISRKFILK